MKTAVLFSLHYLESKRKAGFHWIADALWRKGWKVVFVTAPVSYLSWLRRDHRFQYPIMGEANRLRQVDRNLYSYVLFSVIHPVRTRSRLLDTIIRPIFDSYRNIDFKQLSNTLEGASMIIFESTAALLLFNKIHSINPHAKYVYRVSDDTRCLRLHRMIIEEEEELLAKFNAVSAPSSYIYNRLSRISSNVSLQFHGIDKMMFEDEVRNPYPEGTVNAVFAGNAYFDAEFLDMASSRYSDIHFHIIGPIKPVLKKPNVQWYGEMPFQKTIPYIKYASIGLQTLSYVAGAESFTDSLKMHQYTYCRLPIVCPEYLRNSREHAFYYTPGDGESVAAAIRQALQFNRNRIVTDQIKTWDQLTDELCAGI